MLGEKQTNKLIHYNITEMQTAKDKKYIKSFPLLYF